MNQQEIKNGMSNGEWVAQEDAVTLYTTHEGNRTLLDTYFSMATGIEDVHNCDAICHAINHTYNAGFDPTKVPKAFEYLAGIAESGIVDADLSQAIKKFLNEAKLK